MSTTLSERSRTEAVQDLFDGLLQFSRSLRSRSGAWNRGLGDLSRGDLVTLGVVERQEHTRPGQIAGTLGVDASVVSRQLAQLDRLGLIARCADPADRRAEQISITPSGRERLAQNRAAMCQVLAERVTAWDLDEVTRAASVLEDLADLLTTDPAPSTDPADSTDTITTEDSKDAHA